MVIIMVIIYIESENTNYGCGRFKNTQHKLPVKHSQKKLKIMYTARLIIIIIIKL